jgi:hypothetical protein
MKPGKKALKSHTLLVVLGNKSLFNVDDVMQPQEYNPNEYGSPQYQELFRLLSAAEAALNQNDLETAGSKLHEFNDKHHTEEYAKAEDGGVLQLFVEYLKSDYESQSGDKARGIPFDPGRSLSFRRDFPEWGWPPGNVASEGKGVTQPRTGGKGPLPSGKGKAKGPETPPPTKVIRR